MHASPFRPRTLLARVASAAAAITLLVGAAGAPAAAQQGPAAAHRIYLPAVRGAAGVTQPPPDDSGALYFESVGRTASASAVADAGGGLHAAYADSVPYAEHPAAHYSSCPGPAASCAEPGAWRSVALGDYVDEVQLALTPAGRPRMLIRAYNPEGGASEYYYAACESGCASREGWSLTLVTYTEFTAVADTMNYRNPQRYFALDPQGRPGFVFYDRNFLIEPDRIGMFYAFCAAGCDDAASWSITPIGSPEEREQMSSFDMPSLVYTSQGQPRIVANVPIFNSDDDGITLFGCDAACDDGASWLRVPLFPRGQGVEVGWDIALDAQDRPRIAAFPAALDGDRGERLYYFWCDGATMAACASSERDWAGADLGLPRNSGRQPDLELDARGLPRIAWLAASGDLGYSWCAAACEGEGAQWEHAIAETAASMKAANPKALPTFCEADVWEALSPVLTLDAAGSPRVAYDVLVEGYCRYADPNRPGDPPVRRFERIWRGVRFAFFPQD